MSAFSVENYFDVHNFVKKAKEFGVNEQFAEYEARQVERAINSVLEKTKQETKEIFNSKELATKGDIELAKLELQKEISELRYLTLKFVIWTGTGVTIVVLGGMFSMLKLMLHI